VREEHRARVSNSGAARLSPLVRRLVAPNPSPMTRAGTNTYVVGSGDVIVVDPGPDDAGHVEAVLRATENERMSAVVVTHGHPDHAPAALALARRARAEVLSFDKGLRGGALLHAGGATLEALHTPGHAPDHLSFLLREEAALFSGDLVISGSTVMIAPPDGDMAAYLMSLKMLREYTLTRIYPGHGGPIDDPLRIIEDYLAHRRMRERQIIEALGDGPARIPDLVARIYASVATSLHPLAAQSVHAHLLKLKKEGTVIGTDLESEWRLA
jgi:glyoxylase-like metal-dependent hydrolase (beta-lactamase superfamily II)